MKKALEPIDNLPEKGRYQHFKGAYYQLVDVAHHSETQEPYVVYRALYGEMGLWIRPLVKCSTGRKIPLISVTRPISTV